MNSGWFNRWKANRQDIENYPMINCRLISFSLGLQYLQEGSITVVDVGCGFSDFASQVQQKNPMAVTYYLDGNPDTVEKLKIQGYNALIYQAPARLPFDDGQIEFIHCSHMIEHLQPQELYMLLQEINRTLTVQGVLVLSTPTLWEGFYNDLSHVRPYPVAVLDKYLTPGPNELSSTRRYVSQFRREALFYRYEKCPIFSYHGLRGDARFMDMIVLAIKRLVASIGIYRLTTTGYTAIYRKLY